MTTREEFEAEVNKRMANGEMMIAFMAAMSYIDKLEERLRKLESTKVVLELEG